MATSKTLTPTNVVIQIPDFTEKPDQRVNSNCIDKIADAVNTLNSKIPKYAIKTVEAGSGTTAMKTVTTSINKSTLLSNLNATDILTIIPVGGFWTGGDGTSYAVIKQLVTTSTGWNFLWGGNVTGVVMLLTYIVVYY